MANCMMKVITTNMAYRPKNKPSLGFAVPEFHCNHSSSRSVSFALNNEVGSELTLEVVPEGADTNAD
jgi:hypothetical protein